MKTKCKIQFSKIAVLFKTKIVYSLIFLRGIAYHFSIIRSTWIKSCFLVSKRRETYKFNIKLHLLLCNEIPVPNSSLISSFCWKDMRPICFLKQHLFIKIKVTSSELTLKDSLKEVEDIYNCLYFLLDGATYHVKKKRKKNWYNVAIAKLSS